MFKHHKRRSGLSTIVGAIFFIAIAVAGYNLIMFAMNQYDTYNTALSEKMTDEWNRMNEKFDLVDLRIDSNKFNITLQNTGSEAIKLIRLWVTNSTAVPEWYGNYTLTDVIGPAGAQKNIGQSLPLVAKQNTNYVLKVVTERGNTGVYSYPPAKMASIILDSASAILPLAAGPSQVLVDGTNFDYITLDFEQATDKSAIWKISVPASFIKDFPIDIDIFYTTSGSGAVVWQVLGNGRAPGESYDAALTSYGTVTHTAGSAGTVNKASISNIATSTHSLAAGDQAIIQIIRDADNASDTLNADARLLHLVVKYRTVV